MGATFSVCDVISAQEPYLTRPVSEWFDPTDAGVVHQLEATARSLISSGGHAFIHTLALAFNHHYPVSLAPDHIWLMIARGVMRHISLNTDALRDQLGEQAGQTHLNLLIPTAASPSNFPLALDELTDKLRNEVGADLFDLFTPVFSTTQPADVTTLHLSLLDSMQSYFEVGASLCGIPSVTLEGTIEDWQTMREQVGRFADYDLGWWVKSIQAVLDQFIRAFEGDVDADFWQNMFHYDAQSGYEGIDGWIALFFPYYETFVYELEGYSEAEVVRMLRSREPVYDHLVREVTRRKAWRRNPYVRQVLTGKMRLRLQSLIPGFSSSPVRFNDTRLAFSAGFIGVSQNPATLALRPEIGWLITDEQNADQVATLRPGLTEATLDQTEQALIEEETGDILIPRPATAPFTAPVAPNDQPRVGLLKRFGTAPISSADTKKT